MDIHGRLKLVFWMLVLGLWGTFMYQYFHLDIDRGIAKAREVKASFAHKRDTQRAPLQSVHFHMPKSHNGVEISTMDFTDLQLMPEETSQTAQASYTGPRAIGAASDFEHIQPQVGGGSHSEEERKAAAEPSEGTTLQWPDAPAGFSVAETEDFRIYMQAAQVDDGVKKILSELHGSLMLDLIAFSPWTRNQKVLIYIFDNRNSYAAITGRPEWTGGTSSLSLRTVYVINDDDMVSVLAHELTHIYFDSFFSAQNPSPLWLSEGMAVFIQTERGNAAPTWLTENLELLRHGAGFKTEDLITVKKLDGMSDEDIKLWYSQSYSTVRFMMRLKNTDAFYQFCRLLKDGDTMPSSMFRAYGMPFNRVQALDYAWRYDLQTNKLTAQ